MILPNEEPNSLRTAWTARKLTASSINASLTDWTTVVTPIIASLRCDAVVGARRQGTASTIRALEAHTTAVDCAGADS